MALHSEDAPKTTLKEDLLDLARSPRELWIIYAATFFEYLGIFSFLSTLKFWLSTDHHMSDQRAGWWAATFSTLLTLFVFFVGPLADAVGVRTMLILSFSLAAVTRLAMSLAPSDTTAIAALLAFGFAYATTSPVLQTAVQKATTKRSRAFGFSLWYVSFNLAGTFVGQIIDGTRDRFRDPVSHALVTRHVQLPLLGDRVMSAHAAILAIGFVFAVVAAVVVSFIRKGFGTDGFLKSADGPEEPAKPRANPARVLAEVLADRAFWRFMFLLVLFSLVKLIFQHMHFTWPTYVTRVEGESFPVGKVWALNSFLILFLAPLGTAVTRGRKPLDVLLLGAFITAASPFILTLGSGIYFQLAMVVTLTIGEALWSPRLYEYNLAIAPPGRESTYVSLSALPFFFAKLIVGPTAGYLLAAYCPEHGARQPAMLWAIIATVTMVGPVGILLTRNWIAPKPAPATDAEA
ncbi:MAG: MFS transporter [Polyangiales bacterium]